MTGERHDENETRRPVTGNGFSALPVGARVGGRYTIDHVIAHGGFGITYGARHEQLGRLVAIKEHFPRQFAYRDGSSSEVRPSDPATFTWALDRFLQEGRALVACEHPNVVRVTDIFEENGTAYMALAYEEGTSLKAWLDRLGRAPSQVELDRIAAPLLDALHYVHGQGLLHRDIAPDNVMVRHDGSPCLIDFGAARQAIGERSRAMSAIVKTGYSPPEQYTSSGRSQGPWSDIYALSATLYRALTGRIPPEATERMLEDVLLPAAEAVEDANAYRPAFLAGLDVGLRLKAPERPQSVDAWRDALFGSGSVASASQISPTIALPQVSMPAPTPALRPPSPRSLSATTWLSMAGVGVIALGSMMALSSYPRPPAPVPETRPPAALQPPLEKPQRAPPIPEPATPEPAAAAKPVPAPSVAPPIPPPVSPSEAPGERAHKKQLEDLDLAQRKAATNRRIAEDNAAQLKAEEETRKLANEKAARLSASACAQLDQTQCKANAKCAWVASTVFIEGRPANPSFCGPAGSRQRGVTFRKD